ncbi:MAG: hypothetical protein JRG73_12545 [Deltaproteobacteria bacterium]|nr:hypothetical protein [Deltaproteobacteria bacterium]MBW2307750.1 hypothetical protein [Deltaproteobacteria bacterium]
MKEGLEGKKDLDEDRKKVEAETLVKMLRARAQDYIAITLGVGTVFLLWLLQWMGFY